MKHKITLKGKGLTVDDVVNVARYGYMVEVSRGTKKKLARYRKTIDDAMTQRKVVYAINTGFGPLCRTIISNENLKDLQKNLVMSHSCSVGKPVSEEVSRSIMLICANNIVKGHAGVSYKILITLLKMLNKGVSPVIPRKGSVGASGDLAPLAHMALVLIGKGEAYYKGKKMSGKVAMNKAKIPIVKELKAKEGIGLLNGTHFMTAIGCLVIKDAEQIVKVADVAAALTIEALQCLLEPFHDLVHKVRPHPGQSHCARNIKKLVNGSEILKAIDKDKKVQDTYSIRCIPQVHGAVRDTLDYVKKVVEREINSSTGNPLIFEDRILSGGNFHGEPIALVMDFLGIAISELGSISERRVAVLVDKKMNGGLPAFLIESSGVNSGFMITQYVAAALASENKTVWSTPSCVDTIPTAANQEDHVSMGAISARSAREIIKNVQRIIAIEMLCACQAIDFRKPLKPGKTTYDVYKAIRMKISFLKKDRPLYKDIENVNNMILYSRLIKVAEKSLGRKL